jgi:DNA-binding NtrC family response regulator
MLGYSWPGNVRELKNVIERATLLQTAAVIEAVDLPPEILGAQKAAVPGQGGGAPAAFTIPPGGLSVEKLEDDLVRQALEQTRGNQTRASQLLGISRDSLRYRMKKTGLLAGGEDS